MWLKGKNLPQNYIDDDLVAIFRPLNILHKFYFTPKFRVKNNRVTPNHVTTKILSCICFSVFVILNAFRIKNEITDHLSHHAYVFGCTSLLHFFISLYDFSASYKTNVLDSNDNVDLMIKIQRISSYFKDQKMIRKTIILHWVTGVAILLFHIHILVLSISQSESIFLDCFIFIQQSFDLNIIYPTFTTRIIRINFKSWVSRAKIKNKTFYPIMFSKKTFQIYLEIIETFELNKKCFKRTVRSQAHTFSFIISNILPVVNV